MQYLAKNAFITRHLHLQCICLLGYWPFSVHILRQQMVQLVFQVPLIGASS